MQVHWVLTLVFEDGSEVEFRKISAVTDLPKPADVVELDGEARFCVTVSNVWRLGFTPLVRFKPRTATQEQIEWLRQNGWTTT